MTALVSFGLGQLLYRLFRKAEEARLRHAMLIVTLSWGIIPLLGAIPFLAIASHLAASALTPLTMYKVVGILALHKIRMILVG